jgi:hypothetical protein
MGKSVSLRPFPMSLLAEQRGYYQDQEAQF